jgi:4-hydroxy-2-oxoheptanedioate aldolase
MKTFADLLSKDGLIFGTWSQIPSPDLVEILGCSGFDFTIIDMEHTSIGFETAETLIRACNAVDMVPLVRLPRNERAEITRALDVGAAAVVLPGIASFADARAAIEATRFEPDGTRGSCPFVRSGGHFVRDWKAYSKRMDEETGAILLIEKRGVLSDLEVIAELPGLGCLLVGPFDLSVSLGYEGNYLHPEVQASVEHVASVGVKAGVPVMMPVFAPEIDRARMQLRHWVGRGVRLFAVGGDKALFSDYCTRYLAGLTEV